MSNRLKMDTTITFHLNSEDKNLLNEIASKERLTLSSYVRFHILKMLDQKNNQLNEVKNGRVEQ